jgi:spore coat polysaccharide biosynthesis predicted glycosyltransferase SpsG
MIVIRTKGNHSQGMGDITGALAVAESVRASGGNCVLAVDNDIEAVDAVRTAGVACAVFDDWHSERRWWEKNSSEIDAVLFNRLNSDPVQTMEIKKTCGCPIATFDDNGKAAAVADLRFNPLYFFPDSKTGPEYVPLREPFRRIHGAERHNSGKVKRLFITFGGSDTYGVTPLVCEYLSEISEKIEKTVILTGTAFRHTKELNEVLVNWKGCCELLDSLSTKEMIQQMLLCDMAVCAAGITLFEMACVGTPVVVVANEKFESETAENLKKNGFGLFCGYWENITREGFLDSFTRLFNNAGLRREQSAAGVSLVDGRGAERVAADLKRMARK